MSTTTSRLGLYLPGGGSTGTNGADETADIDKINGNFAKLDTAVYPSAASVSALAALASSVPEGGVVGVRTYAIGAGQHFRSLWQKNSTGQFQPAGDIGMSADTVTNLITYAGSISAAVAANPSTLFLPTGAIAADGGGRQVRWTGTAWIVHSGFATIGATNGAAITLGSKVSDLGSTQASRTGATAALTLRLLVNNDLSQLDPLLTLPVGFRPAGAMEFPCTLQNSASSTVGILHTYYTGGTLVFYQTYANNGQTYTSVDSGCRIYASVGYPGDGAF